ncbi:Regulator of G-protein signaling 20 [Toxocara canis]|uniref:Regulator of G-protein signaling 20 n=1 Tax=Toxocara canis TaxID=6265 RepID=A0A0B2W4X5_TOXCA|nr:Regulator of G-protein signaling 20 [Toxocara canis]
MQNQSSTNNRSPSPSSTQRLSPNEWTYAFDKVITDDEGRSQFTKFLQSEYSEENILFWWAVQELRLCAEDRAAFEKTVQEMFDTFIAADSPLAINIDHDTRTEIIERVQMMEPSTLPDTIFDKAQAQIYRLMEKDCFSRFVHTQAYKDLARSLSLPHTFRFNGRLSPV